jgi:hypothetical protein
MTVAGKILRRPGHAQADDGRDGRDSLDSSLIGSSVSMRSNTLFSTRVRQRHDPHPGHRQARQQRRDDARVASRSRGSPASTSYWWRLPHRGEPADGGAVDERPDRDWHARLQRRPTRWRARTRRSSAQGVGGKVGMRNASNTLARYDDFTIEPNVGVSSTPVLTVDVAAGVPGDVDARGEADRDRPGEPARRFVEWGLLQQRYYQGLALQVDSDRSSRRTSRAPRWAGWPSGTTRMPSPQRSPRPPSSCARPGQQSHGGAFRVVGPRGDASTTSACGSRGRRARGGYRRTTT